MKKLQLSQRITAYAFDENPDYTTYVYRIDGKRHIFIIDTAYGPADMELVTGDIPGKRKSDILVINTHFHWDHVWGNCFFNCDIIAHSLCSSMIDSAWDRQLSRNKQMCAGRVEKKLPTIVFEKRLFYPEDGVELFHSPGHTADSISIADHVERVLFAGDNLEKPLVYVENKELNSYISTLNYYKNLGMSSICAGHTLHLGPEDIDKTIDYLKALQTGKKITFLNEYEKSVHEANLRTRGS